MPVLLNYLSPALGVNLLYELSYFNQAYELTTDYSGIRVFGELEFWLSSIKVLTLIGM
jgi:amino acid permease